VAGIRDKAKRNAWARERTCIHCGKVESVRKDNKAEVCRTCTSRTNGIKSRNPDRPKTLISNCLHCGKPFNTFLCVILRGRAKYCSKKCMKEIAAVHRTYKQCGIEFMSVRSRLSEKTNSTASYCSLKCCHDSMAIPGHTNGRGSRWIKLRRELISQYGKCACCGKSEKLSVHHMIPWRFTHDNHPDNLVVLCRPCHAREDRLWKTDLISADGDFLLARTNIRKRIFGEHEA
jgi:hypothetical protein